MKNKKKERLIYFNIVKYKTCKIFGQKKGLDKDNICISCSSRLKYR